MTTYKVTAATGSAAMRRVRSSRPTSTPRRSDAQRSAARSEIVNKSKKKEEAGDE